MRHRLHTVPVARHRVPVPSRRSGERRNWVGTVAMRQLRLLGLGALTAVVTLTLVTADTAAQAPAPPADQASCPTHTVRSGDWVDRIATEYGASVEDILRLNPAITAPDFLISAGDLLVLPERRLEPGSAATRNVTLPTVALPTEAVATGAETAGGPTGLAPCPTYTVRAGDWVHQIATDHGVSVGDVLRLNPAITVPDLLITPGQMIVLFESPAPDFGVRRDVTISVDSPGTDEFGAIGATSEGASVSRTKPADASVPVDDPAAGAATVGGPAGSGDDTVRLVIVAFALGLLLGVGGTWALVQRHRYTRLG